MEDLLLSDINSGFDGEPVPEPFTPAAPIDVQEEGDFRSPTEPRTSPFEESDDGPGTLVYNFKPLVFEDVYEACVDYAGDNCCYGKRFPNQMKLTEIINRGVFHYRLESFGEKRESGSSTSPYRGGSIDGPENGHPPDPWDITVLPSMLFKDSNTRETIPHTESVHTCSDCSGSGIDTCGSCNGHGYESCWSCSGSGRDSEDSSCSSCSGSGSNSCRRCGGSGRETCSDCSGYGKITKCRTLIVTWKNHPSNFITNADLLPTDLIFDAKGVEIFRETDSELQPLANAPDPVINAASARLLQSHKTSFPGEIIKKQRHGLRAIPFTRVAYKWKEREGELYIYGTDRRMYFEDYPQKYCCCTCC